MFRLQNSNRIFINCYQLKCSCLRLLPFKFRKRKICYNVAAAYNIKTHKSSSLKFQQILVNDNINTDIDCTNMMNKELVKITPPILFKTLENLENYCIKNNTYISDQKFDYFIDNLTDSIKYASDQDLKTIFASLSMLKVNVDKLPKRRNYIEVWAALNDECCNRRPTMTIDEILTYMSLFHKLNVVKYTTFCFDCCSKFLRQLKHLSKTQVVAITTYIGMMKYFKKHKYIHNIEVYIMDNFDKLEIEELASMSQALYKIDVPIRNTNLTNTIINKIIKTPHDHKQYTLLPLLKLINISVKFHNYDMVYLLCDYLSQQLPQLSDSCHFYISSLGESANRIHEPCLIYIAENVLKCISTITLFNLEKIIFAYGHLNYIPPTKECFITKIVEELKKDSRKQEINKHGRIFVKCLVNLCFFNVYPQDLLKKVLSKEFLNNVYGKSCYLYDTKILALHNAAKVFYRDFNISELSDKEVLLISNKSTNFIPEENTKLNVKNRFFLDIKKALQSLRGGSEYVIADHILTHYKCGDIIICNNHQGVPHPVADAFKDQPFGTIRYPPDNNTWIVLIVSHNKIRNQTSEIQKSTRPSGEIIMKKRQLDKLGYHSTIISMDMYRECSDKEKVEYLDTLINEAIIKTN